MSKMSKRKNKDNKSEISSKLDEILKPLGNTTRQELLLLIAKGPITYTEVYTQLNLESGSFYWHIKKMSLLVIQTEDKLYYLSELGKKAYELLTFDGEIKPEHINPKWVQNILIIAGKADQLPLWVVIQQIIFFVAFLAFGFSSLDIIQIGSLPTLYKNTTFFITLITATLSLIILSSLILISLIIIEKREKREIERQVIGRLFIQLIFVNLIVFLPGVFTSILLLLSYDTQIVLNSFIIFPVVFISTIISILLTMGIISYILDYEYRNSLLIVLIIYYPFIIISYLLQSFYN